MVTLYSRWKDLIEALPGFGTGDGGLLLLCRPLPAHLAGRRRNCRGELSWRATVTHGDVSLRLGTLMALRRTTPGGFANLAPTERGEELSWETGFELGDFDPWQGRTLPPSYSARPNP